jgi:hypothetical protein
MGDVSRWAIGVSADTQGQRALDGRLYLRQVIPVRDGWWTASAVIADGVLLLQGMHAELL